MCEANHDGSFGVGGGAAVGEAEENEGGGIITGAETVIGGIPGIDSGVVIVCNDGIPGIATDAEEGGDGKEVVGTSEGSEAGTWSTGVD